MKAHLIHGIVGFLLISLSVSPLTNFAQSAGTKRWEFTTGGPIFSSPAIADDGTIYVGSDDKKLYAINPNGSGQWEFVTQGVVKGSPAGATVGPFFPSNRASGGCDLLDGIALATAVKKAEGVA